jgi:cellobiose phosphorylase
VDKIKRLAVVILDANSLLISTIRKSMPKVLQKVTGSGHTSWTAFCSAVRTATLAQIAKAKEEEKEAQDLWEQVRRLQELHDTSVWDVTNALQ